MDFTKLKPRIEQLFNKYKFVALVIAAGILLMLWPASKRNTSAVPQNNKIEITTDMESKLEALLSQVKGAGRVEVMLTEALGENTVFQTNKDGSGENLREDTVIITDSERGEGGLVVRKDPPSYQGAIVVCDGADDAFVRLQIVEAVSRATGLGADRISVLKMK